MNTLHEYAAKAAAAGDYVRDWLLAHRDGQTVFERRSQMRRADSARIEATTVDRALADASPEASIQLAGQRDAFVRRIDELRAPGRTLTRPESLELFHLAESVKRIDAATFGAGVLTEHRLAEFGPTGNKPRRFAALGALGGSMWLYAGAAFMAVLALLGVQTARLNHAKGDLEQARTDLTATTRALEEKSQLAADLAANITAASHNAAADAETIERERARNAAARRRERDLLNEIRSRTADVGEPPAWSLRDGQGGDPAGSGAGASGDSGDLPR